MNSVEHPDCGVIDRATVVLNAAKKELEKLFSEARTDKTQQAIADILNELPCWKHLNDVTPGGDE